MALEAGVTQQEEQSNYPRIAQIPFESKRQFSATLHQGPEGRIAFVKGSPEKILKMSSKMVTSEGEIPLDPEGAIKEGEALATAGFRLLALASGSFPDNQEFTEERLENLTFLG